MKTFHRHGPVCIRCLEACEDLHPTLVDIFDELKTNFPDLHISCGYRGEKEQNEAFKSGASKLKYPKSRHNKKPSEAMDLFQLSKDKKAIFSMEYYRALYEFCVESDFPIEWGGNWAKFVDGPHFELTKEFMKEFYAKQGRWLNPDDV